MKPKKYSSEKISLWLDDRIQKAYVRVYDGGFEQMDDYIFANYREELERKYPYFVFLMEISYLIGEILFEKREKEKQEIQEKKEKEAEQRRIFVEKREAANQKVSLF